MSEPITIEWLKERMKPIPANNFEWTEEEANQISDLAISQAETIKAQAEALDDMRRLTRELDVAMSGEDGAAKQASLCDLIPQAKRMRAELAKLKQERTAALTEVTAMLPICDLWYKLESRYPEIAESVRAGRKE